MRAVITVVGHDAVGILAKVSGVCAEKNANVVDVTQTVLGDIFSMVMLADIDKLNVSIEDFRQAVADKLAGQGLVSHVMHEDIFNAMHRI